MGRIVGKRADEHRDGRRQKAMANACLGPQRDRLTNKIHVAVQAHRLVLTASYPAEEHIADMLLDRLRSHTVLLAGKAVKADPNVASR